MQYILFYLLIAIIEMPYFVWDSFGDDDNVSDFHSDVVSIAQFLIIVSAIVGFFINMLMMQHATLQLIIIYNICFAVMTFAIFQLFLPEFFANTRFGFLYLLCKVLGWMFSFIIDYVAFISPKVSNMIVIATIVFLAFVSILLFEICIYNPKVPDPSFMLVSFFVYVAIGFGIFKLCNLYFDLHWLISLGYGAGVTLIASPIEMLLLLQISYLIC